MSLVKTCIYLDPGTKEELEKIAQRLRSISAFTITKSDLIRFALHEVYGTKFRPVHIWESDLKEKIQLIKKRG